jgi:hypothetical protein
MHGSTLCENLPATIKDAITVTTELGYRYLWIGRYCKQDEPEEEKMRQIQEMNLIYQHAEVVIIATFGWDPTSAACHKGKQCSSLNNAET